eukprot:COSAG05_NODE_16291_length_349_cov_0.812000_1_plen_44_part_10
MLVPDQLIRLPRFRECTRFVCFFRVLRPAPSAAAASCCSCAYCC